MHLSNHDLFVILATGLVAGWLAGVLIRGSGFGIVGDVIVGCLGALVGRWLLPHLDIHIGTDIVGEIVNALIGALVLLFAVRLLNGGRVFGRRW